MTALGRRMAARAQSGQTRPITADRGATAVEYGIMLATIAAVIIVAAFLLGTKTVAGLDFVSGKL